MSLLLVNMLHTIIQESIMLSSQSVGAAYAMFALMIVLFLALSIVITIFHLKLTKEWYTYRIFSLILQHIGAILYFVGDNITQLVVFYGGDLEAAQIVGTVFIGIALVIFLLGPQISHVLREKIDSAIASRKNKELDEKHWCTAIDALTVILKIDILYSAIIAMIESSEDLCSGTSVTLSTVFLVLCMILGLLYMGVICYVLAADKNPAIKYRLFVLIGLIAIVGVCFCLHILMDNELPLDCGFGCGGFKRVGNTTVPTMTCDGTNVGPCCDQHFNSSVRLAFTLVNFLILTVISLLFGSAYLTTRFENLPDCSCVLEVSKESQEVHAASAQSQSYGLHHALSKFSRLIVDS